MMDLENILTTIGAMIEISYFIYEQMEKEGFTADQAFETAQKFILQTLPNAQNKEGT